MKNNKFPVSNLSLSRSRFAELIIVAIFLGFGISLTSSSVTLMAGFNPMQGICIGSTICIISIIYVSLKVFTRRTEKYSFNGFFILNEHQNKIVKINGYKLSEELRDYFENAFLENKDLEYIWNNEPLKLEDELKTPEPRSMDIIREALEYFLLEKLSSHLASYFKYPSEKNKNISVLERKDIPSILLSNRFLELISKPIQERIAFDEVKDKIKEEEWYSLDVAGGSYKKFYLVLPYKSKVTRTNNGEIEIKTHKFNISMKVHFDGCNDVLPDGFREHYLSIDRFEDYLANVVYKVEFKFCIRFRIISLFSSFGWKDYNWIDSFLDLMDKYITKESFFDKIKWDAIATLIKCLK